MQTLPNAAKNAGTKHKDIDAILVFLPDRLSFFSKANPSFPYTKKSGPTEPDFYI